MSFKKGFTLVEVVVVIGIVAILTVIIFPSVSNIRAKNRDTERVADIAALQLALSLYYNQAGVYPATLDDIDLIPKYTPEDSKIPPNSDPDYQYEYVPLSRQESSDPDQKCTYYHLGTKLELPSTQIDAGNTFSSLRTGTISNGYKYCGDYTGDGLPNWTDGKDFYTVRP